MSIILFSILRDLSPRKVTVCVLEEFNYHRADSETGFEPAHVFEALKRQIKKSTYQEGLSHFSRDSWRGSQDGDEESGGFPTGGHTLSGILIGCSTLEKWFKRLRWRQGSTRQVVGLYVPTTFKSFVLVVLVLLRKPR